MSTMPWAPANRADDAEVLDVFDLGAFSTPLQSQRATKWLSTDDVSLRAIITGQAGAAATLSRLLQQVGMASSGQASVSANLAIARMVQGSSAGQATAGAIIGHLFVWDGGSSAGSSDVSGTTIVGQTETVAAQSAGLSAVVGALSVDVPYRPVGIQVGDFDPTHPTSSARSDGKVRRVFTPVSSGLTNSKSPWVH